MTTLVLIAIGLLVCVFSAGLIAKALRIAPQPPSSSIGGTFPSPTSRWAAIASDTSRRGVRARCWGRRSCACATRLWRRASWRAGSEIAGPSRQDSSRRNTSGLRPGHYHAFLNLTRHAHLWDEACRTMARSVCLCSSMATGLVARGRAASHGQVNSRSEDGDGAGRRALSPLGSAGTSGRRDQALRVSFCHAEQLPPPSTQNLAQCGWQSFTAPFANMPPSARAACANVAPISKAGS